MGHPDHVYEGAQRGRDLPVPEILEVQPFERWRPVLQHAQTPSGVGQRHAARRAMQ